MIIITPATFDRVIILVNDLVGGVKNILSEIR
jgi:hypothetical protein